MKHIKLFEQSFSEEAPTSITIELTDEFKERTKEYKNSEGNQGFTTFNTAINLYNNGSRYNMVKVSTIPYDLKRDIQFDFWASYRPKANEIYVDQSNVSLNDLKRLDSSELQSTQPILSEPGIFSPGYYCKFENGFKVGEVDHRGYFRIVAIS